MSYYRFSIILSASVPSEKRSKRFQELYTKIKNAQIQIEEAVIALSRNIFHSRGKIIFGGHPSISPLISMVATEYPLNKEIENTNRNEQTEKPITIFQSRAFEKVIPDETKGLYSLGYSSILWTEAVAGEQYDPSISHKPQCEKSLDLMRRRMLESGANALVCIGGMEGVESEFELFRKLHPQKPIYLLKSTGGAAKMLAEEYVNDDFVRVIDNIELQKPQFNEGKEESAPFDIIPYSFITGLIVNDLIERRG